MTANLLSVIEQQHKALEMLHGKLTGNVNGADESCFIISMKNQVSYAQMERVSEALAAGKQALEQTQGEACKYANICNEEGECTSGCAERKNAQPVAYVVFASNGNIRIWGHAPDDVKRIKAEFGSSLIPLYTNPQATGPAPTQWCEQCGEGVTDFCRGKGGKCGFGFQRPGQATEPATSTAGELTTCNCRWNGDVQVQSCTLHAAHFDAIHEWAERAKTAEAAILQSTADHIPDAGKMVAAMPVGDQP